MNVGVIGAGMISQVYLANLTSFRAVRVKAVADIVSEKAVARASEFNVEKACSVEEVLSDPSIELIVNLTVPTAHAEITMKCIEAGKHVYSEKPLATNREDGKKIVAAARSKRVEVGCAPDTFLGGGFQTARKLLDDGWIGKPLGAISVRADHGPDEHPNAAFFYQVGGGPVLDMAPYYLTELVNLFGPMKKVAAMSKISFSERTELSKAPWGRTVQVEVPTLFTGTLEFTSGVLCSTINSFDVWAHHLPHIEVFGTSGSLQVPNPNRFGGNVKLKRMDQEEWVEIPPYGGFMNDMMDYRGIGVLDMVLALQNKRMHRTSLQMAYHVLDAMVAMHNSAIDEKYVYLESTCERPSPLPLDTTPAEISPLSAY
jgi:predicted dehydrogenase